MLFSQTNILIIGASVSGLACAASLRKLDEDFVLIEKANEVAAPWRSHYERLHLHTNKRISSLPYLKFAKHVPRYPSRMEVVEYLDNYRSAFRIEPRFNTEAISVEKNESGWLTKTTLGNIQSTVVI